MGEPKGVIAASPDGDALRGFSTGGHYVNFQTFDEGEDRIREAYGRNFARLTEIKVKYDPDNLFRMNRNIHLRSERDSPRLSCRALRLTSRRSDPEGRESRFEFVRGDEQQAPCHRYLRSRSRTE